MTHHARLILSNSPSEFTHQDTGLEVRYIDHDRFGVDEARALQHVAWQMPSDASTQTLVIRTNQMTIEAQNALLKLFEDPPATTSFMLILPVGTTLLPTLLSRVVMESVVEEVASAQAWDAFVAASPADRLVQIADWQKKKDADWLKQIKTGLRLWLQTGVTPSPTMLLIVDRLGTRGAGNKMLLEALALEKKLQNT